MHVYVFFSLDVNKNCFAFSPSTGSVDGGVPGQPDSHTTAPQREDQQHTYIVNRGL